MEYNKKLYVDLNAYAKKASVDKKQINLLKKDMDQLHVVIQKGGDIVGQTKKVISKYPELMRIYVGNDVHDAPGCIILILILILLLISLEAH